LALSRYTPGRPAALSVPRKRDGGIGGGGIVLMRLRPSVDRSTTPLPAAAQRLDDDDQPITRQQRRRRRLAAVLSAVRGAAAAPHAN